MRIYHSIVTEHHTYAYTCVQKKDTGLRLPTCVHTLALCNCRFQVLKNIVVDMDDLNLLFYSQDRH